MAQMHVASREREGLRETASNTVNVKAAVKYTQIEQRCEVSSEEFKKVK